MTQEEKREQQSYFPKGHLDIISKMGSPLTTHVTDSETGEQVRGITAIDIHIEVGKPTTATLHMSRPWLDLQGIGITEYREYLLDTLEKDHLEWERTHPKQEEGHDQDTSEEA